MYFIRMMYKRYVQKKFIINIYVKLDLKVCTKQKSW